MNAAHSSTDDTNLNTSPVVSSINNYLGSMDVCPVFFSEQYDRNKMDIGRRFWSELNR